MPSWPSPAGEPVLAKDEKAFLQCAGQAAGKARLKGRPPARRPWRAACGRSECAYGRVGAGSCVEACTFGALSVEDGNVTVDRDKCNGAGPASAPASSTCSGMVPAKATNFVPLRQPGRGGPGHPPVRLQSHRRGDCVEACPEGAVSVVDNRAVIDYEKCVGARGLHRLLPEEDHRGHLPRPDQGETHRLPSSAAGAGGITMRSMPRPGPPPVGKRSSWTCSTTATTVAGFGDCVQACRFDALKSSKAPPRWTRTSAGPHRLRPRLPPGTAGHCAL